MAWTRKSISPHILAHALEHLVDRRGIGHVAMADDRRADLGRERFHALLQRIALIRQCLSAPCSRTALAMPQAIDILFATPQNEAALPGHQLTHADYSPGQAGPRGPRRLNSGGARRAEAPDMGGRADLTANPGPRARVGALRPEPFREGLQVGVALGSTIRSVTYRSARAPPRSERPCLSERSVRPALELGRDREFDRPPSSVGTAPSHQHRLVEGHRQVEPQVEAVRFEPADAGRRPPSAARRRARRRREPGNPATQSHGRAVRVAGRNRDLDLFAGRKPDTGARAARGVDESSPSAWRWRRGPCRNPLP